MQPVPIDKRRIVVADQRIPILARNLRDAIDYRDFDHAISALRHRLRLGIELNNT